MYNERCAHKSIKQRTTGSTTDLRQQYSFFPIWAVGKEERNVTLCTAPHQKLPADLSGDSFNELCYSA